MADFYKKLEEKHCDFIKKQLMFTVASAPNEGRVNVSPKGMESFKIIDENTVAYLDLVGSANETAAHILDNGRITIMFMSFDRNPLILRIFGKGEALQKNSKEFKKLISEFPKTAGVRQIIRTNIESVSTSCGYGVPVMDNPKTRETMAKWHASKDKQSLKDYQRENNLKSIDGLDTGLVIEG